MRVLAIVPARGGSRGVVRKNIRPLGNRPLLEWSLRSAFLSRHVTDVVVSTEDPEIKAVSERVLRELAGKDEARLASRRMTAPYERADVPQPVPKRCAVIDRPAELATDEAATDPVLVHALRQWTPVAEDRLVVLLQPTVPFRPPWLIDAVIDRLIERDLDSSFTATAGHFGWMCVGGVWCCTAPRRPRRQDMKPEERLLLEDGSVYVTRGEALLRTGARITGHVEPFEVDGKDRVDIDTHHDWELAEHVYHARWRAAEA